MLGIVFIVISAIWFGFATIGMRRGVATASALNGLYLTLLPGVPLFWLAALVSGQAFDVGQLARSDYGLLAAAGVVHFLVGRYCSLRSFAAIGANRASPVIVGSVLVSVGFAVTLLDEEFTPLMAAGTALLIVGPGIAIRRPARAPEPATVPAAPDAGRAAPRAQAAFDAIPRERLLKGYAWALATAVAFGVSPILIREALGDSGLGVLGGALSYTMAGLLLLALLATPGQLSGLRRASGTAQRWFLFGALTIILAQLFRFLALSHAPVTVVVPLMRGGIVFTILLSFIFNRSLESFDRRVLAGIAVSLAGSVALVI